MGPALAVAQPVQELGVVVAASAAGAALLLPGGRARALAALAALALTPVLLVGELWDAPQVESIRTRPALAAVALLAALAVVAAIALLVRRTPWLVVPLAVFTLPFRIPLESGGESANLLVPLYLVIAGGVAAYAWDRLVESRAGRGGAAGNGAGEVPGWRDPAAGPIELAVTALVVLYALQAVYSSDFETALKNVAFFYVPFMLMLRLVTSVQWTRVTVWSSAFIATGLALLFACIGFAEYSTKHLFWNQKVIAANEFESYFRVNSLFFDPNIYGRFLAMVMIGLAATLLWPRRGREIASVSLVLAVLWGAMVLSFSQSSFAALLTGLAVLAALRWGLRPVIAIGGAVAVAGIAAVLIAPGAFKLDLESSRSLDRATSGRLDLMRGGVEMFADRPLTGFGSGAFGEQFRKREGASKKEAASASHTMPITFAAEQGLVGLGAYLAVLVAAFALLFRGLAPLRGRAPPLRLISRAYVAAAFAGLVLHTLLYAAFLEDPISWMLLAAGIVLARPLPASSGSPASSSAPASAPGAQPAGSSRSAPWSPWGRGRRASGT